MLSGMKELNYTESLNKFDLPKRAYRRNRRDMIDVYKMMNGRHDQDIEMQLPLKDYNTRGNQNKLYKEQIQICCHVCLLNLLTSYNTRTNNKGPIKCMRHFM